MSAEYIAYDDGLITACEGALRRHWRKPNVILTRRPKGSVNTFYSYIDATKNIGVVVESKSNSAMPLPVLPIHPFNPINSFFFGIRLRFDHRFESTHSLTSASLYVFAGTQLAPVIRAEWDERDVGKTQHAQPHWHLLGAQSIAYDGDELKSPNGAVDFVANPGDVGIEVGKIHFPMSASWQVNASAAGYQHRLSERGQLVNWMLGITGYLSDQLTYVTSKRPGTAAPTRPMEFNP